MIKFKVVTYKYISFLLRNWRKFTQNMTDQNKPHLKALYAGLKELEPDEQKLLHYKYLSSNKVLNHKELAPVYNLTPSQIAGRVNKAKGSLENIIIKQAKEHDNDKQNNADIKPD